MLALLAQMQIRKAEFHYIASLTLRPFDPTTNINDINLTNKIY